MTTQYVRKTGNDTTGDGSSDNPWLTLAKAYASASAGDTIKVGDGTYQEDTSSLGYWYLNRSFATAVTIEAESGAAGAVYVQGSSHATYNTRIGQGTLIFNYINFTQRMVTNLHACTFTASASTTLTFNNCTFTIVADNATITQAFYASLADGYTLNVTFSHCTFTVTGTITTGQHDGCRLTLAGTTGVINATLTDCTATGRYALWINGCACATVTRGTYTGLTGTAILLGLDAASGAKTSDHVTLTGVTAKVTGSAGHGILVGNGCTHCIVTYCIVNTCYDYALVLKEHGGTTVTNCLLHAGTVSATNRAALYLKAVTGATVQYNSLYAHSSGALVANCLKLGQGDTGNKCQDNLITYNRFIASGSAVCLLWSGSTGDNGGCTNDHNRYKGKIGTAYGSAISPAKSLAALRGAWATYTGHSDNDTYSHKIVSAILRLVRHSKTLAPQR
jgi:hypothetical protein